MKNVLALQLILYTDFYSDDMGQTSRVIWWKCKEFDINTWKRNILYSRVLKLWVACPEVGTFTFTWVHLWVTNTFRIYLKMGTFTLSQVHFLWKTFTLLLWVTLLSLLYLNRIQVKNASILFQNALSTFLWAMSDAHLRMIHYFESILFKGLIKPVGKPDVLQSVCIEFISYTSFTILVELLK